METKDDVELGYGYPMDYLQVMRGDSTVVDTIHEIELPSNFKTVITKLHPEIKDVVAEGFRHHKRYDPSNFHPLTYFEVILKVYFNENEIPKGNKDHYENVFEDLFKMTYGDEMKFISFAISSLVVPPAKTNEEKFAELFVKNYARKSN